MAISRRPVTALMQWISPSSLPTKSRRSFKPNLMALEPGSIHSGINQIHCELSREWQAPVVVVTCHVFTPHQSKRCAPSLSPVTVIFDLGAVGLLRSLEPQRLKCYQPFTSIYYGHGQNTWHKKCGSPSFRKHRSENTNDGLSWKNTWQKSSKSNRVQNPSTLLFSPK